MCLPDLIAFQNKSIGGEFYEWNFGDGTVATRTDTLPIFHLYPGPGRYTVKLKAIDLNTCIGRDSTYVTVDVYQNNAFAQDDDDICFGEGYQLRAYGGTTYFWTNEFGTFTSGSNTPIVAPEDTTEYYVTITDANGCVKKDTVVINVIPGVNVDFEYFKKGACFERPELYFNNLTEREPGVTLTFDFGDNSTSDLDRNIHAYEADSTYHVKLTGVREFCVYEKAQDIPVYTIKVGNVITPLVPEGKNDAFFVQYGDEEGLGPYDYGIQVAVRIYNRWGSTVFESNDYKNTWSGENVATGVYYYDVSINGDQPCKGWVHVIK